MPGIKAFPPKTCQTCGAEFSRKRINGRMEDAAVYAKRKYCSLRCANTRTDIKPKTYLWRARQHRRTACEACGYTKRLAVHHCDQNQQNNDLSNLQTLCSHCHDFWHATAKRLGRTVAGRMPSLAP